MVCDGNRIVESSLDDPKIQTQTTSQNNKIYSPFRERDDDVEMSELKLERLLKRERDESEDSKSKGGMFSLFARGSLSSSEVRTRLAFGVDSGVIMVNEQLDTTLDARDKVARFPRTVSGDVAVCDLVRRRVGVVGIIAYEKNIKYFRRSEV